MVNEIVWTATVSRRNFTLCGCYHPENAQTVISFSDSRQLQIPATISAAMWVFVLAIYF